MFFDGLLELLFELRLTRGKGSNLLFQSFDFNVGLLKRDQLAQFRAQCYLLVSWRESDCLKVIITQPPALTQGFIRSAEQINGIGRQIYQLAALSSFSRSTRIL